MRVTFLVSNYAPSQGGVQEHVGRVAEGLVAAHGVRVDVLTSDTLQSPGGVDPGRVTVRDETIRGVHVHRRPVARRLHALLRAGRRALHRLGLYEPGRNTLLISGPLGLRLGMTARRLVRRSDVVVGVTAPTAALWAAGALSRGAGAAVVAMPLIHLDGDPPRRWALRAVRRADAVTTNSAVERDWLVDRGVAPDRVRVLPPGCDPGAYPDLGPAEARERLGLVEAPTVGFVGRLAVHKGIDVLVAAMRAVWLDHPDARLLVAGTESGADLRSCLATLSAAERSRVSVWGGFTDDERPLLLASSDVVAHPSRSESFGMVTVEAWCARRPVVVADIDVTRSLVRRGIDGELVPVGDSEALAHEVSALLSDPQRCTRYGAAGRERAVAEFAWPGVVAGWDELLTSLAPDAGRPGRST